MGGPDRIPFLLSPLLIEWEGRREGWEGRQGQEAGQGEGGWEGKGEEGKGAAIRPGHKKVIPAPREK